MVYYIDGEYGCDKNDGLSRITAWRSLDRVNAHVFQGGDSILFKAGCVYSGSLRPKREVGSQSIVFGRYGTGDKPEIAAPDDVPALDLVNFQSVEVRDLSFTAPKALRGIFVTLTEPGIVKDTYIHDCLVHDVNRVRELFHQHFTGGIIFSLQNDEGWFDGVRIEDNEIVDVCRTGIMIGGTTKHHALRFTAPEEGGTEKFQFPWHPALGVVVRGNYIDRTGGDGILVAGARDPLIEWNRVFHIMTNPKPRCANAGIWPQSTIGAVVQYNEVGYSNMPEDCADAQGFDVDTCCVDTLVQYNYSHDNAGGFLLLCDLPGVGTHGYGNIVVRNNLSVNDGNVKGESMAIVGPVRNALIENNTICTGENVSLLLEIWTEDGTDQASDVTFRNNLFVSNGKGNLYKLWNAERFVFENNAYAGKHTTPAPEEIAPVIIADPQFALATVGEGRDVCRAYIPTNPLLRSMAAQSQAPATEDLLGSSSEGTSYIGAILPVI